MSSATAVLNRGQISTLPTLDFIVSCTIWDPDFNVLPVTYLQDPHAFAGGDWFALWGGERYFGATARDALEAVALHLGIRICDHPGDVAALCAELAPALCSAK